MTPSNGFYIHYKHDPAKAWNDHTYEVLGLARHSEEKSNYVVYRPLYENDFMGEAQVVIRPLGMFLEDVTVEGKTMPRFAAVTDPALIERLQAQRDTMYPK